MPSHDRRNVARAQRLPRSTAPWERKLWYARLRSRSGHFRRFSNYDIDRNCESVCQTIESAEGRRSFPTAAPRFPPITLSSGFHERAEPVWVPVPVRLHLPAAVVRTDGLLSVAAGEPDVW